MSLVLTPSPRLMHLFFSATADGLSPPRSQKESNSSMLFLGRFSTEAAAEMSLSSTDSVWNDTMEVSILGRCFGLTELAIAGLSKCALGPV